MALPTLGGIPPIPAVGLLFIFGLALWKFFIQPAFLGPLSRIPNAHWSAPISRLWILNERRLQRETPTVHAAHQNFGPIIRLAPNEISVNSVDGGIRTIYAGGYEKGDWYSNVFSNYDVMPMFAMPEHGAHSKRKRMLSNIYAKSTLQTKPSMHAITTVLLNDRLIPELRTLSTTKEPVEFYTIFCAITIDFVSAYVFGLKNSSNYLQQPQMGVKFFRDYKARHKYMFWPQDMPDFTRWMKSMGLISWIVPAWVDKANQDIEAWILNMLDKAEATVRRAELEGEEVKVQDWPTVYAQLRNALLKEASSKGKESLSIEQFVAEHRLSFASEMLDHTLAGFDTSSITLTFLAHELSLSANSQWQKKLREELTTLKGEWDAKVIDELPVLHAILMETLRLHAPIPGNQPRITPQSATLGAPGHSVSDLPPNIRVQAQAWSLHRNPDVFPDPESWNPSRWLDSSEAQLKEMQRWFWAFGSGGRMCVGSNLAILDMKAIVAAIWSTFETAVIDDVGMVHNGGYVAEPVGKDGRYLLLKMDENAV